MKNRIVLPILTLASLAVAAQAQVIDGSYDAVYGAAKTTQNTQTSFGDSNLGQVNNANGSELDAAYARVSGGTLYLFLSGNLESNYNKLELFFDVKAGGQNQLRFDNPDVDFNGLNRMGAGMGGPGMKFDAGFEPDYWMSMTGGGDPYAIFVNYSELLTDGGGTGYYLGTTGAVSDGTLTGGNNPNNIFATLNNSNTGGVTGGTGTDNGTGVSTGMEFAIPLAALGNPTGPIRITAMINGGGHDFMSNQVLAGIGGGDHLGEPRLIDFSLIAGDQFFTVTQGSITGMDSVSVIEGDDLGEGDLNLISASDNTYYSVLSDGGTLRAIMEFSGVLAGPPTTSLGLKLESRVARLGLAYSVRFKNVNTNAFVFIGGGTSTGIDTTVTVTTNTPASYVTGGNRATARVTWQPINDEDPAIDGWEHAVDLAQWVSE